MEHKILVIEDDDLIRRNISQLLRFDGYDVIDAPDGVEGVKAANEHIPSLILCDIMMPKMDGIEVLGVIRSEHKLEAVPFIFITAKAARQDIRAGMNGGANDYLTKPFTDDELLDAVRSQLNRVLLDSKKNVKQGELVERECALLLIDQKQISRFVRNIIDECSNNYEVIDVITKDDLDTIIRSKNVSFIFVTESWSNMSGVSALNMIRSSSSYNKYRVFYVADSSPFGGTATVDKSDLSYYGSRPFDLRKIEQAIRSSFAAKERGNKDDQANNYNNRTVYVLSTDESYCRKLESILKWCFNVCPIQNVRDAERIIQSTSSHVIIVDELNNALPLSWILSRRSDKCSIGIIKSKDSKENYADIYDFVFNRAEGIKDTLRVVMRDMLKSTGSYQYNLSEYLKHYIIDIFSELLKRTIGIEGILEHNVTPIVSPFAPQADETVLNVIKYKVKEEEFALAIIFEINKNHYEKIINKYTGYRESEYMLLDLLRDAKKMSEEVAANMTQVLNTLGFEIDEPEVTSRIKIDQIVEPYHWCVEDKLISQNDMRINIKYGITIPQTLQE